MSGLCTCSSCSTSPSAMRLVVSASTRITGIESSSTISWKLREYRKSPTSTLGALPHRALAVLRPRRRSDSSTTSSCSRVEVWMNSTMAASTVWSLPCVAQGPRGQHGQHRAQAFAAAGDDVLGNLVDQHHIRTQACADQGVYLRHFLAGQGLNRFNTHKIKCLVFSLTFNYKASDRAMSAFPTIQRKKLGYFPDTAILKLSLHPLLKGTSHGSWHQ